MQAVIDLLVAQPLLLLFIVSGLGYALGQIKIAGVSLGVAAVLFVGLAFGALSPEMEIPVIIVELGLIVFVYTIGLASGPGFFASFKRKGLRDNLFVFGMLIFAAVLTVIAALILDLKATVTAGMYAGSLTNTPALASLLETVRATAPPSQAELLAAEPVIGYSVAYPMGVIGMLIGVYVVQRAFRIDYRAEAQSLRQYGVVELDLVTRTVRVESDHFVGIPLRDMVLSPNHDVIISRVKRGETLSLASGDTVLERDDLVALVGPADELDGLISRIGTLADEQLELDRRAFDFRRIFVSNPDVVGKTLSELHLTDEYGAIVSRVRRGDIDLMAAGDTVLELGDRVRVVARRHDMSRLTELFGDSYKALSEVNLLSLNLGLALGVLVGLIPIPLPGGVTISLGLAGGPLIVGLVLGARRRTGPLVWTLPYSANLTLRQVGLILLLAGIGVRSGYTFFTNFSASGGIQVFVAGAIITMVTAFLTLLIGHKLLKIPFGLLTGVLSGLGTQPATLGFALQQADNELPNIGYALAFPIATITKIVVAQLILLFLGT